MEIPIHHIDAFVTDGVFTGNPAAVCPLAAWLPDDVMQKIAAENNLAETAFFVGGNGDYSIRWMTPAVGDRPLRPRHPGLRARRLLRLEKGRTRRAVPTPPSGALAVRADGDLPLPRLPVAPPARRPPRADVAEALGRAPGRAVVLPRLPGRVRIGGTRSAPSPPTWRC